MRSWTHGKHLLLHPLVDPGASLAQKPHRNAVVAELADALDLGSSAARRGGSTPPDRTTPFALGNIP